MHGLYVCILLITSLFMGVHIYIYIVFTRPVAAAAATPVLKAKFQRSSALLRERGREREMWSKSDIGRLLRGRFKLQLIHQKTRLGLYHYHCTCTVARGISICLLFTTIWAPPNWACCVFCPIPDLAFTHAILSLSLNKVANKIHISLNFFQTYLALSLFFSRSLFLFF